MSPAVLPLISALILVSHSQAYAKMVESKPDFLQDRPSNNESHRSVFPEDSGLLEQPVGLLGRLLVDEGETAGEGKAPNDSQQLVSRVFIIVSGLIVLIVGALFIYFLKMRSGTRTINLRKLRNKRLRKNEYAQPPMIQLVQMDIKSTGGSPERVHPGQVNENERSLVHGLAGSILSLSRVQDSEKKSVQGVFDKRSNPMVRFQEGENQLFNMQTPMQTPLPFQKLQMTPLEAVDTNLLTDGLEAIIDEGPPAAIRRTTMMPTITAYSQQKKKDFISTTPMADDVSRTRSFVAVNVRQLNYPESRTLAGARPTIRSSHLPNNTLPGLLADGQQTLDQVNEHVPFKVDNYFLTPVRDATPNPNSGHNSLAIASARQPRSSVAGSQGYENASCGSELHSSNSPDGHMMPYNSRQMSIMKPAGFNPPSKVANLDDSGGNL